MKLFIDAGHNPSGADTGASGNGLKEQDVTLAIAQRLGALLTAAGHSVKLSRETETDRIGTTLSESLSGRCQMANEWGAELFVSIHCNAGGGTGTETLIYSSASRAALYADEVCAAVSSRLSIANRGVKERPGLAVLKGTTCPAILVETAFIDNASDAALLRDHPDDFAAAIAEGITGEPAGQEENGAAEAPAEGGTAAKSEEGSSGESGQTVMHLNGVWIQEIAPLSFGLHVCDCQKRSVGVANYFNAGLFAVEAGGGTIPVGNLADSGVIYAQAKDNPPWINVVSKQLSTIVVTDDGAAKLVKTDRLDNIPGLRSAVSGVPVIAGGKRVSLEEVRAEGYDGSELYDTWHGFLGIRAGQLVYVAAACDFSQMCWTMAALGVRDAIKLDGGGSFLLHNGRELAGTSENRRINNVGMWSE